MLSLYLHIAPDGPGIDRKLESEVGRLVKPLRASLSEDVALQLSEAVRLALGSLASLGSVPRSIAVFACPGNGFVRIVPLPEPVGKSAHFDAQPYLSPLLSALDEHERTVVVLVDREHARVFRVFLGQIEEVAHLEGYGRRHGPSGRSQLKVTPGSSAIRTSYGERNLERRDDWHVRQHLERTIAAMHLDGDRVLVGGGLETVHELVQLLPRRIRSRTRLIPGLSLDAPIDSVLQCVLEAQRSAEREEEEELVGRLLERDRARTVFGLAAVAEAVCDKQVHTLVYGAGTSASGAECLACGWLMPGRADGVCGRCGGSLMARADLIEQFVTRVHSAGARVEEVRDRGELALQRSEGVAALLRYVPRTLSQPAPPRVASVSEK